MDGQYERSSRPEGMRPYGDEGMRETKHDTGEKMHEAKEQAGEKMHEAKEQAGEKMHEVREQAGEKMDQMKVQAHEATEKAEGYVRSMVDERTEQAGHWLSKTGQDLTEAGSTFRERGEDVPARASEFFGRKIQEMGSYMESRGGDQLLQDAQRYARRNVWPLTIGGLILGFAAARAIGAGYRYRHDEPSGQMYGRQGSQAGLGGTEPGRMDMPRRPETMPAGHGTQAATTEPRMRPVGREPGSESGPERRSGVSYG